MLKTMERNDLRGTVTASLTCVEQRLESKAAVRDALLAFVDERYVRVDSVQVPEDIPVSVLERLHRQFGFGFEAHGGKLTVVLPIRG